MKGGKIFAFFSLVLIGFLSPNGSKAATCTTLANGVWDCVTPAEDDILIVNHVVTIADNWRSSGNITVNAGGDLTITGNFEPDGSASLVVYGTLSVSGNMRMRDNSSLVVENGGLIEVSGDFRQDAGASMTIKAGGEANFDGNTRLMGTSTIDGDLSTDGNLRIDGSTCGSGSITYSGGCNGGGTACGDPSWCDGSGTVTSGTLPVELVYFTGELVRKMVVFTWETASEINNEYFTVERLEGNSEFKEIQVVPGAGNSDGPLSYFAHDLKPPHGVSYYRLKQTDFDGKTEEFNTIMIHNFDKEVSVEVYPNPVSGGEFFIDLYSQEDQIKILLSSIYGNEILSEQYNIYETGNRITVKLPPSMKPGVYVLSTTLQGQTFHHKLIIN
ncbi:MAG: T9SS type A sorting domain-containing protein [Cyclobacteriaceae bacterium]